MNVSGTASTLTYTIKSTFEHESSNGKTYEIEYEITLEVDFHPFSTMIPDWVTVVEADNYNQALNDSQKDYEIMNDSWKVTATTMLIYLTSATANAIVVNWPAIVAFLLAL